MEDNDLLEVHMCSTHNKVEEWTTNPFDQEIYNEENWQWLCEDCYHDAEMDI